MQAAVLATLVAGAAAQSQCLGEAGSYGNDPTCLPSWKPTCAPRGERLDVRTM
jgi:hypothetical protein